MVAHDRWAGICGVLPPGLMVAMAATRQERPAADQRAHSKQLEAAVKQIRRTLAWSMTHLYDQRFGDAVVQGEEEDHILAKKAVSAVWRQTASVYGARAPRGMVSRTKCADAVLTALHHHRQLDPGPPPYTGNRLLAANPLSLHHSFTSMCLCLSRRHDSVPPHISM